VNPLDVHFYAKSKNVPSIFSDGDGRILVGETVLTSIIYRRAPLFINVARKVVANNWTRTDYGTGFWGGYSDDAVGLASYGGTFYDRPAVRVNVERTLDREIDFLRRGVKNGFCGVSSLGLRPGTTEPQNVSAWMTSPERFPFVLSS
jgi:basic membrane lipoprotein Med (substrate-binding protein (PBP1-ABC) superfamily)